MKKKILSLLIIFCVLFMNLSGVLAEEVGINDIITKYLEYINDTDYTLLNENNKISISLINPTYGPYSIDLDYTDNTISYVNNRDVSSASDELKAYYASADSYFISALLLALFNVYNVDIEAIPEDIDYAEMGIDYQIGDVVVYENENGGRISVTPVSSLFVDLALFKQFAQTVQSTTGNSDFLLQMLTIFKSASNPMTDSILSSNLINFDDVLDEVTDGVDDSKTTDSVTTVGSTEKVKVPSTSANAKNLILGIFAVAIASGIGVYVFILKTGKK